MNKRKILRCEAKMLRFVNHMKGKVMRNINAVNMCDGGSTFMNIAKWFEEQGIDPKKKCRS